MDQMRHYTALDGMISDFDGFLRQAIPGKRLASRPNPAETAIDGPLTPAMKSVSAGLMRVDHAGEVCAQALYQGQGLTARNPQVKKIMQTAATEEVDHLVWCSKRLRDLDSHTSYLNPFWYLGSLSLGIMAGLLGDRWSLGFIAETEHQVVRHLDTHLVELPDRDHRSRAILEQMRIDESHHATVAVESGAAELPLPVRQLMRLCSRLMTSSAYWI
jgi:ubiquinone biosynthesis monooxygenase Coq7